MYTNHAHDHGATRRNSHAIEKKHVQSMPRVSNAKSLCTRGFAVLSTSVHDWHYAWLQTRNAVETNQCPSAVPLSCGAALSCNAVPAYGKIASPWASCLVLWVWASVRAGIFGLPAAGRLGFPSAGGWLAGVWLVFGWRLRGLGRRTRPAPWPAALRMQLAGWWLFNLCGGRPRAHGHDGQRLQCH